MQLLKSIFIVVIISLSVAYCKNDDKSIEVSGTIQKQGITTYQYGTHTIAGYALRSEVVVLDDYVNQEVTVIGHKVEGYPIDGGPEYIEVEKIK